MTVLGLEKLYNSNDSANRPKKVILIGQFIPGILYIFII
jgi:hypothetical protein